MFFIQWVDLGMPAENVAKQNNLDPKTHRKNILNMKSQLKRLDSIDWEREISTCSEDYYNINKIFFRIT